jgi:hypothetical protein
LIFTGIEKAECDRLGTKETGIRRQETGARIKNKTPQRRKERREKNIRNTSPFLIEKE